MWLENLSMECFQALLLALLSCFSIASILLRIILGLITILTLRSRMKKYNPCENSIYTIDIRCSNVWVRFTDTHYTSKCRNIKGSYRFCIYNVILQNGISSGQVGCVLIRATANDSFVGRNRVLVSLPGSGVRIRRCSLNCSNQRCEQ